MWPFVYLQYSKDLKCIQFTLCYRVRKQILHPLNFRAYIDDIYGIGSYSEKPENFVANERENSIITMYVNFAFAPCICLRNVVV